MICIILILNLTTKITKTFISVHTTYLSVSSTVTAELLWRSVINNLPF